MDKKLGFISDIHGGHARTTSDFILGNLKEVFSKYNTVIKGLDYLILPGDIFDKPLIKGSQDDVLTTEMIGFIVMYCVTYKIKLRWLRGTISHDGKQAEAIVSMIRDLNVDIDFAYYDDLTYVKEEDGLEFIYLPDEYKDTGAETKIAIERLLKDNNIEMVDFVIMHGQYDYQLPITSEKSHDFEFMNSIVRERVFSGHIHKHSILGKIVSVGSFDRLAHNEEEKKGMIVYLDGVVHQLVNHDAKSYVTIKIQSSDIVKEIEQIKKKLTKLNLRDNSYVSIKNDKYVLDTKPMFKHLKETYPMITFTYNPKTIKKEAKKVASKFKTFSIDKENIEELLRERLVKKFDSVTTELILAELVDIK